MIIYELKCYVNEEEDNDEVYSYAKEVLKRNNDISVYKSWENGYHFTLFGTFLFENVKDIYNQLSTLIRTNPSNEYSQDQFIQKYLPVAKITNQLNALEPIFQNVVNINKVVRDYKQFQNDEQYEIYMYINSVFDDVYMDYYWSKDITVNDVFCDIFPFVSSLPETTISEEDDMYSSGYVSHLSHYLGFLHSLSESNQQKIEQKFRERANTENMIVDKPINNRKELSPGLMQSYERICTLVDTDKINFYSPLEEAVFLERNSEASFRHRAVFEKQVLREKVIKDKVLCTNRWISNVLYEKLVLLGIPPIEKFYLNYLISRKKYTDSLLGVE
ncbi:hypothetical protein [Priestia taiwanensis]|uniref:Uncharacterized protein n=1 Tax=Priestia taiwanensis TaxID=1347902 RepID=A0A917ELZ3_9BACI|nr:hypothetical protein [Priestia taiwanensis]MBM7362040.1 hypothetical protein [Priestia taiwanensis]GGE58989.1 hypothetical protein GCM10007140_06650 [Priestia taiwanensis]